MKILVIRTAPLPVADWVVQDVSARLPGARVHVLTRSESADHFENNPLVEKVFSYPFGFFDYGKARATVLPALRKEGYDRVAFIYNSPKRNGFFHVEAIANSLSPETIMAYDSSRRLIEEPGRGSGGFTGTLVKYFLLIPALLFIKIILKGAALAAPRSGNHNA